MRAPESDSTTSSPGSTAIPDSRDKSTCRDRRTSAAAALLRAESAPPHHVPTSQPSQAWMLLMGGALIATTARAERTIHAKGSFVGFKLLLEHRPLASLEMCAACLASTARTA